MCSTCSTSSTSHVAEDVGMAADDLVVDPADDIRHAEAARFGGDLRLQHDLQQQIAQLLLQRGQVVGVERVQRLVGFLQQVRARATGASAPDPTGSRPGRAGGPRSPGTPRANHAGRRRDEERRLQPDDGAAIEVVQRQLLELCLVGPGGMHQRDGVVVGVGVHQGQLDIGRHQRRVELAEQRRPVGGQRRVVRRRRCRARRPPAARRAHRGRGPPGTVRGSRRRERASKASPACGRRLAQQRHAGLANAGVSGDGVHDALRAARQRRQAGRRSRRTRRRSPRPHRRRSRRTRSVPMPAARPRPGGAACAGRPRRVRWMQLPGARASATRDLPVQARRPSHLAPRSPPEKHDRPGKPPSPAG